MTNEKVRAALKAKYGPNWRQHTITEKLGPVPLPDRNAPCCCGSGKKFKKCCMLKPEPLIAAKPIDVTDAFRRETQSGRFV